MWCPQCKSEYVRGMTRCPECDVDLVFTLPEESEKPVIDTDAEFVEIMNTYDAGVLTVIKSILDDVGIPYFIKGEHSVFVFSHIYPAHVLVLKQEAEKAKELLKDLIQD
jgi:hypothetical protein